MPVGGFRAACVAVLVVAGCVAGCHGSVPRTPAGSEAKAPIDPPIEPPAGAFTSPAPQPLLASIALTPAVATARTCDRSLPAAACARGAVERCAPGEVATGEWRFALIGSLYEPFETVTADQLAAAWRAGRIAATAETRDALGFSGPATLAAGARPELAAGRWAIVPAHELMPAWKLITVDASHPLEATAAGVLTVPLCGAAVRNIDPERLTTIAMTGTSALTRFVAQLMEKRGLTYPIRDVEPWLRAADFVHISHEVSLLPHCDLEKTLKGSLLCGRDPYIELLEASHANIIELTGSHLIDHGRRWLTHTIDMYAARGWVWFGGGRNQLDASTARIVEHHGNRVAFVGCNRPLTQAKHMREGPGVAMCDLERVRADVVDLRRRGIVPIVSIQHEEVYVREPPKLLVHDFRKIAEAGAAVVFGSQAHVAHPWEVHHGAYVHYGAGNFLFDQQFVLTRDAAQDKLYVHDGKLLSVGRLFTRIEEWGRPRPMAAPERVRFLRKLAEVRSKLPPAAPWAAPRSAHPRQRADSFLVGGELQRVLVTAPAQLDERQRYGLVIDLVGNTVDDTAYVVRHDAGKRRARARAAAAATYMRGKYPIDPGRVTTVDGRAGVTVSKR